LAIPLFLMLHMHHLQMGISTSHGPCPTNLPHYLPQTPHPLDEVARRHPTRLDHLAIFAAPYTIFVANPPMQKRILIRVDAA
jgi:hypothetical protein